MKSSSSSRAQVQQALDKKETLKEVEIDEIILKDLTKMQILPLIDYVKYLGQQLNLVDHTDNDIDERIRKGWNKFNECILQLFADCYRLQIY